QVSWLTSLLHADILSSRFDQQANSPGSWTKLALKPLLLKRIQNASLETCAQLAIPLLPSLPGFFVGAAPYWMFHQEHLVTKMDQVLMSCENVLEEKHKTKHAGAFNIQDASGVTLDNNGGAKKNIRNNKNGFPRCILDPLVKQLMV
ncbi:Ribitol-5-phosphate cytidylyltransferase, partial [Frankliniella fusca]